MRRPQAIVHRGIPPAGLEAACGLGHIGGWIIGEIGLGQYDDRLNLGLARERQIALQACWVEVLVARRDDQEGIDIGCDQLNTATRAWFFALEEALTLQQTHRPIGLLVKQHPVADGRTLLIVAVLKHAGVDPPGECGSGNLDHSPVNGENPNGRSGFEVGKVKLRLKVGGPTVVGQIQRFICHDLDQLLAPHRGA